MTRFLNFKANSHHTNRQRQTATDTMSGFVGLVCYPWRCLLALVGTCFCPMIMLNQSLLSWNIWEVTCCTLSALICICHCSVNFPLKDWLIHNWQNPHHPPVEPHYSCRWKDSITLTTKNDRKRKLHILPLFPPPLQRLEFTAVTSALRHQLLGSLSPSCLFSIFSSLALGCFSISTERRQALSQLGTDGKITAREGVGWEGPVLNTEEHTHQTGETALQGQSNTRDRERVRAGEGRGQKGYVRRKKERSASLNIEKGCYSLLLEAWPRCTATDVDH